MILCIGNPLMGDDGFGHKVGEYLENWGLHVNYSTTLGLDKLPLDALNPREVLHVIDAVYGQNEAAMIVSPLQNSQFLAFRQELKLFLGLEIPCYFWGASLSDFSLGRPLCKEGERLALHVALYLQYLLTGKGESKPQTMG